VSGPAEFRSRTQAALDELALLRLGAESPQSVLQKVVDLVQQVMPDGADVSITLLRDGAATTAAFTGRRALDLDEVQYGRGHGPCMEAAASGQVVEISDGRTELRWPEYVPAFLRAGALSSLAVPVPAAEASAGLNVYAPAAAAFTDEDRRAATRFADFAAVALMNMDALQDARELADDLRLAMDHRSVIEQAKGILMERHRLTPDLAFRRLAEASMRRNRKLHDIAEDLVRTGRLES
jgi:GAF domain-containing protein